MITHSADHSQASFFWIWYLAEEMATLRWNCCVAEIKAMKMLTSDKNEHTSKEAAGSEFRLLDVSGPCDEVRVQESNVDRN